MEPSPAAASRQAAPEPFGPLLAQQRVVISDGGMGTLLEHLLGRPLDPLLWSAGAVLQQPEAVVEVHRRYFAAGADIATAASYQGTLEGYTQRGCSEAEAAALLRKAVRLAIEARDEALALQAPESRRPLLVAASVGCYGAAKADGSEYRGDYGKTEEELVAWHRPRLRILAEAGADLLAFETIPCLVELRAVLRLITAEHVATCHALPCWVTLACKDGATLNSGEPLTACATLLDAMDSPHEDPRVVAFGVNCTPPQHAEAALALLHRTLAPGGRRLLMAYPNSGEAWDGVAKLWKEGSGVPEPEAFAALAERWVAVGARVVGGCCRTTPATIAALRRRLVEEGQGRGRGEGKAEEG